MKTWSKDEVEILCAYYNTATNSQLALVLPEKSPLAIYKKAYKLGLRKNAEIEFRNRSEANKGEKSGNWKGGTRTTKHGYRQLLRPGHHRADRTGYVMEHIVVFEEATGIRIPDNCCVHHLNGDKSDNRIENLCMMQHTAHTVFHHTGAKRSEETKNKIKKSKENKNNGT